VKTVLAALVLTALPLTGQAATLDIKTGAWEITESTTMSGMPIPKEAMAGMSPEQRAKMEAAMAAHAGSGKPHVMHSCVTQQDLDRSALMKSEEPNCKRTVITQSARHLEMNEVCTGSEPSQTHFKFDASSNERYTGSGDMTRGNGKVHIEMSGRWLGATCKKGVDD
jgi:hypothetical protein